MPSTVPATKAITVAVPTRVIVHGMVCPSRVDTRAG
jgi:hypothetical protein